MCAVRYAILTLQHQALALRATTRRRVHITDCRLERPFRTAWRAAVPPARSYPRPPALVITLPSISRMVKKGGKKQKLAVAKNKKRQERKNQDGGRQRLPGGVRPNDHRWC